MLTTISGDADGSTWRFLCRVRLVRQLAMSCFAVDGVTWRRLERRQKSAVNER
jgi:hypothetical protein